MMIAPTEPPELRAIGRTMLLPEKCGVDILFPVSGAKLAGVQRKQFPSDFLSSLYDGRLSKELQQMQFLSYPVLLLEGIPHWTGEGQLISDHPSRFTRGALYSFTLSAYFEFGVPVLWTDSLQHTIEWVGQYKSWLMKGRHDSLRVRPRAEVSWSSPGNRDRQLHFLQGLPQCGIKKAEAILDEYGEVPLRWTVSERELREVPGIGLSTARQMIGFLKGEV